MVKVGLEQFIEIVRIIFMVVFEVFPINMISQLKFESYNFNEYF